jgi:hypothetical protein
MVLTAPKLDPINPESVLDGSIHISWSNVGTASYYVFRDTEPITDISGWYAYGMVETNHYEDYNFENGRIYYYVVIGVEENARSPLSNCQSVKVKIPPHLLIDNHSVEEAAYFESKSAKMHDEKLMRMARLYCIFEQSFPNRDIYYLKIKVKSLDRDLPEFKGLLIEPTESQIHKRGLEISQNYVNEMKLDWELSERELILKKIQELVEYSKQIR